MNFVLAKIVPHMTDSHIFPQVGGLRGTTSPVTTSTLSLTPGASPSPLHTDSDRKDVQIRKNFSRSFASKTNDRRGVYKFQYQGKSITGWVMVSRTPV